ncbi:hypothetical protein FVEG_12789 [Fusarium verticillioides 7600]|uniref:Uncharacterized protein n=1 Tax=Gibberella moniliformis (strain M3125 / FGSC 7600) TaxID=334819 RepID=W7MTX1_GIBM7|nr:hypothetical protein FVEG_12789 [Fusarium verticillioides 7600]EWG54621.1 hypothetical protein FVEG_12789 [Fusarium verticillioides 7600]
MGLGYSTSLEVVHISSFLFFPSYPIRKTGKTYWIDNPVSITMSVIQPERIEAAASATHLQYMPSVMVTVAPCNVDMLLQSPACVWIVQGCAQMLNDISKASLSTYDASLCESLEEATCMRRLYIIGKADYAMAAIVYKEMERCVPFWLRKPRNIACEVSCNSDCVCIPPIPRSCIFGRMRN